MLLIRYKFVFLFCLHVCELEKRIVLVDILFIQFTGKVES